MTPQEFKEIRLVIGLSQQQLASKLGILKKQISKIERGKAGITEQKEEARDSVSQGVRQLNLDFASWSKRQEDNEADQELNETQEVATFNQLFLDPSALNNPLNVELEGLK